MCVLPELTRQRTLDQLESAAAVYFSGSIEVGVTPTELAQLRGVDRSTIYRRAARLPQLLASLPVLQSRISELSAHNFFLQQRIQQLEAQLSPYLSGHWVQLTPERLAHTTLEMTARHSSISDVQATLQTAFDLDKPPSDGTLAAIVAQGARLAEHILDSVSYHFPLNAIEFDELYHAQSPILASLEPYSMALIFLEQLGNCRAHTWKFAFDYHDVPLPQLMVHDCSSQGNLLVKLLCKDSQLCIFHRIRNIGRELHPQLETLFEKALKTVDERLWQRGENIERQLKALSQKTHLLDFERWQVRRFEQAYKDLLEDCEGLREEVEGAGLSCKSLSGLELRPEYLAHLKLWEKLAEQVEFREGTGQSDGFVLLDALAREKCARAGLEQVSRFDNSALYWEQQKVYLEACEHLRKVQTMVKNNRAIQEQFELMCGDLVRTSSRIEALNRRLRGFTDAKRQVTERQLRLMQLHHNTTPFSADAKRAGKSPWQWLGLDVPGLTGGFVGVLKAASQGADWPAPWAFKG